MPRNTNSDGLRNFLLPSVGFDPLQVVALGGFGEMHQFIEENRLRTGFAVLPLHDRNFARQQKVRHVDPSPAEALAKGEDLMRETSEVWCGKSPLGHLKMGPIPVLTQKPAPPKGWTPMVTSKA